MDENALQHLCQHTLAAIRNGHAIEVSAPLICGCRYLRLDGVCVWLCTCPKCVSLVPPRIYSLTDPLANQLDIFQDGARGGTGASEASSLDDL